MSSNIISDLKLANTSITISSLNINDSKQSQNNAETRLELRIEPIIKMFKDSDSDIILIQEWRASNPMLLELLKKLPEYWCLVSSPNGTKDPFCLLTLYKKERLLNTSFGKSFYSILTLILKIVTYWFSDTPTRISSFEINGWGNNFSRAQFQAIDETGKVIGDVFDVYNIHMPFKEELRIKSLDLITSFLPNTSTNIPFIAGGDFNLHLRIDKEEDAGFMRRCLLSNNFSWFSRRMVDTGRNPISHTYFPYPYESNQEEIKKMRNDLDHFIGHGIEQISDVIVDNRKMDNGLHPSDHFLLSMSFRPTPNLRYQFTVDARTGSDAWDQQCLEHSEFKSPLYPTRGEAIKAAKAFNPYKQFGNFGCVGPIHIIDEKENNAGTVRIVL